MIQDSLPLAAGSFDNNTPDKGGSAGITVSGLIVACFERMAGQENRTAEAAQPISRTEAPFGLLFIKKKAGELDRSPAFS
jgi:hypothetical protein